MAKYHDYIFNLERREFLGKFEEMYQAELVENFDAHGQDSLERIDLQITKILVDSINPTRIVDIGSGKGLLTSLLNGRGRTIFGSDISETALEIARRRDPEITYIHLPDSSLDSLTSFLLRCNKELGSVDVVVMSQVVSYIEHWKDFIEFALTHSSGICIATYLPENPIGFVADWGELCSTVDSRAIIQYSIWDSIRRTGWLLATRQD
jgi:2-polyprenyl-3-methyl-5-hydroxy-6-metoxy-1,4-benzoquinol methylase